MTKHNNAADVSDCGISDEQLWAAYLTILKWVEYVGKEEAIAKARSVLSLTSTEKSDGDISQAARDVLAERQRQIVAEGWTPEHDDKHITAHGEPELAIAGACYAMAGTLKDSDIVSCWWPWDVKSWKPTTPRRNFVKAAALLVAEIERIDRAAPKAAEKSGRSE